MKNLCLTGIILLCCLAYNHTAAQKSVPINQVLPAKPELFARVPGKFRTSIFLLEKLFNSPASGTVEFPMADDLSFKGSLVESVRNNKNAVTINVRSSNYDGAVLTLSKITQPDLSEIYNGRIVSIRYADVFVLTKENAQYYFTREKQSLLLVE